MDFSSSLTGQNHHFRLDLRQPWDLHLTMMMNMMGISVEVQDTEYVYIQESWSIGTDIEPTGEAPLAWTLTLCQRYSLCCDAQPLFCSVTLSCSSVSQQVGCSPQDIYEK